MDKVRMPSGLICTKMDHQNAFWITHKLHKSAKLSSKWPSSIISSGVLPFLACAPHHVAAGAFHTCVLLENGNVRCFGSNDHGQCSVPTELGAVKQLAAGPYYTCVLLENGSLLNFGCNNGCLRCFGCNNGCRGSGPVLTDLGAIRQVAAGDYHTCVLLENGHLRCFGNNAVRQCAVPTQLGVIKHVAAGALHTCALLEDGSVRCFGSDSYGQCSVPTDLSTVADMPS